MFSDVISLILRDSDTNSENVSLRGGSVSDGQKKCSSKYIIDRDIINSKESWIVFHIEHILLHLAIIIITTDSSLLKHNLRAIKWCNII